MDPSWTDKFYDKLVAAKLITCSIVFKNSTLQAFHSRKLNSPLFQCNARCPNSSCPLTVKLKMIRFDSPGQSVVFRVEINGTPRHDDPLECNQRPLKGAKRVQMSKICN